jgi:hypothetical protein
MGSGSVFASEQERRNEELKNHMRKAYFRGYVNGVGHFGNVIAQDEVDRDFEKWIKEEPKYAFLQQERLYE